ncbi:MAG: primosomal protein N' [Candidatus Omnitrophica bacterium]|nr:primosomal protein N' [Candidatus Omnitrophota bacterium]
MLELDLSIEAAKPILRAQVALPIPFSEPYDYEVTGESLDKIQVGMRVRVPFRSQTTIGIVVGISKGSRFRGIRPIDRVLDQEPIVRPFDLELARWIAEFYFCSWGEAIDQVLPHFLFSREMALEDLLERYSSPRDSQQPVISKSPHSLTEEQEIAFNRILEKMKSHPDKPVLLHGITGSGKTEIYLRLIEENLRDGKTSICLFPEIALSEQIKHGFIERFADQLEIFHSRLTGVEQLKAWLRVKSGQAKVVLGPRSALFAPLENLGLIIMDEEQEFTYKQDQVPRYHAREAAKKLAELSKCVFLMGTATPTLETRWACEQGTAERLVLSKRVVDRKLPEVEIVDLAEEFKRKKRPVIFSDRLKEEIAKNLELKQGVLIFLNRRGFSTFVHCLKCGTILSCKHCQVSLTFHMETGKLICHYCNYQSAVVLNCPSCNAPNLKYGGMGTEKTESELGKAFPRAKIARVDSDVARKRGKVDQILAEFKAGKIDIVVGTQMIAKGFDFPQVTLVGVVLADISLSLPDFRSSEKTFQLLTQVAGRAGRGEVPGRVIVQSYLAHHHVLKAAQTQDYELFYNSERDTRKELLYPPFAHLINIIFKSKSEKSLYDFSRELKAALEAVRTGDEFKIMGPSPLPLYKLKGFFRWHLMLKGESVESMNRDIRQALGKVKKPSSIQLLVDVDPVSVL